MRRMKLSVLDTLVRALPEKLEALNALVQENAVPENEEQGKVTMQFMHDITTTWNWADLDPANPNDVPNLNLMVMGLILATNAETTRGGHAWTQTESSLSKIGFTNMAHHYFEGAEKINHPAMVFGRSTVTVKDKTVVAAIFRGSSSTEDFISDLKAEPGGFHQAGINATNELKAYLKSQNLTKENTILFITGHSYGAASASLVGIMSAATELAERDSIFCYSFATPNYIRHGVTGDGMKMFSFDSNEDIVPQVPVGPNLDKTGVCIKYDRIGLQLYHPEKYERFLNLYRYFRDRDYDEDYDFMPLEYSFKPPVRIPVNNPVIRNHMPYTYMAFILAELPDEVAYAYLAETPGEEAEKPGLLDLEMYVGEVYRLPLIWAISNQAKLTWASSDEAVVSIGENGMLAAKGAGDAQLTVTTESGRQFTIAVHVKAE